MIYTITLNPSIDYYVDVNNLRVGETNIGANEKITLGGKGLNVAYVLDSFKLNVRALTCFAGMTGKVCEALLKRQKYKHEIIWLKEGNTRINIKLRTNGIESEINGKGPSVNMEEFKQIVSKVKTLKKNDVLILSGSVPGSLGDEAYKQIIKQLDPEVLVAVDATGKTLLKTLQYRPFLIKPNIKELEVLYGSKINDDESLIKAMKFLKSLGARNVLVSMGSKGAALLNDYSKFYFGKAENEKVINTIGSGDCMLAAYIATYLKIQDHKRSFQMAVAAGSANAYSEGLPTQDKIKQVLLKTKVTEIK